MASERIRRGKFIGALAARVGSDLVNLVLRLSLLSVVTRYLSQRDYGIFSQALTTCVFLLPLLSLRLSAACVRYFPTLGLEPSALRHQFSMTLGVIALMGVAGTAFGLLAPELASRLVFDDPAYAALIWLVISLAVTQALTSHIVDFYRAINHTTVSSALGIARAALNLAAGYAALHTDPSVAGLLAAFVIADALLAGTVLGHLYWRYPYTQARPAFNGLQQYLKYGLPLVPYTLLVATNAVSDRYFITHILGVTEAGRYAFSYGLVNAAMLVGSAIGYVIYPQLSVLWSQGDKTGLRSMLADGQAILLYFTIPIACGLTLVYPALVQLLAGDQFVLDRALIALLALGHLFLGLYGIDVYLVDLSSGTTSTLAVLVGASVINLILNLLLIPAFGLFGAAWATCLTYAAQWLIVQRFARVVVGFRVTIATRLLLTSLAGAAGMIAIVVLLAPTALVANVVVSIVVGAAAYLGITALVAGRHTRARLLATLARSGGRAAAADAP